MIVIITIFCNRKSYTVDIIQPLILLYQTVLGKISNIYTIRLQGYRNEQIITCSDCQKIN